MSKLIIVGLINPIKESGPSNVVSSLLEGLEQLNCNYEFINVNNRTIKDKIALFLKMISLIFRNGYIINVHTYGYFVPFFFYIMSVFKKKNKYYLTVHGILSYEDKLNGIKTGYIKKCLERFVYNNFPNIIFVSTYLKEIYLSMFHNDGDLFVINNGTCEKKQRTCIQKENIFLYAGGMQKLKNPKECINIFLQAQKIYKDATLIMCGPNHDSVLEKEIDEYLRNNGLTSQIQRLGMVSKDRLRKLYYSAKFVIAPSNFDTFNMTVLDAMIYGCVPILSQNCGVKEIVEGNCGLVYKKPSDILYFLNNMNYEEEVKQSLKIAQENTYVDMAQKYINVLKVYDE